MLVIHRLTNVFKTSCRLPKYNFFPKSPVINYVSRHLTTSDNFLFQAFKRLSLGFAW